MNFGLLMLYVHDLQKSFEFYSNVAGLPTVPEMSDEHFIVLRPSGGSLIALEDVHVVKNPTHPAGSMEIGFEVDDIDRVYQDWKAKGAEIVEEPGPMPFGSAFLARDPEGHYITVYHIARQ